MIEESSLLGKNSYDAAMRYLRRSRALNKPSLPDSWSFHVSPDRKRRNERVGSANERWFNVFITSCDTRIKDD